MAATPQEEKNVKISPFIVFINSEGTPHAGLLFPEQIQGFI